MKNFYIKPNPPKYSGVAKVHYLMRSKKNEKILPICRSLKAEDICVAISAATFLLVGTDIYFVVIN